MCECQEERKEKKNNKCSCCRGLWILWRCAWLTVVNITGHHWLQSFTFQSNLSYYRVATEWHCMLQFFSQGSQMLLFCPSKSWLLCAELLQQHVCMKWKKKERGELQRDKFNPPPHVPLFRKIHGDSWLDLWSAHSLSHLSEQITASIVFAPWEIIMPAHRASSAASLKAPHRKKMTDFL